MVDALSCGDGVIPTGMVVMLQVGAPQGLACS